MWDRGSKGPSAAAVGVALVSSLVPAAAVAAPAKPVVTTGGAANIGQSTVVLNGTVNPNNAETTYFFQYGTTSLDGAQTAPASAGKGGKEAEGRRRRGGPCTSDEVSLPPRC